MKKNGKADLNAKLLFGAAALKFLTALCDLAYLIINYGKDQIGRKIFS